MIAPLLFLFFFSMIEFGRVTMVLQAMEEAARSACRVAIVGGATTADAVSAADAILNANAVAGAVVTVSPDPPNTADQWQPTTVTITASYGSSSWLPVPGFIGNMPMSASCTLPHEARKTGA